MLDGFTPRLPLEQLLTPDKLKAAQEIARFYDIEEDRRGHNLARDLAQKVGSADGKTLYIVITGALHIPQLHRQMTYCGLKPYMMLGDNQNLTTLMRVAQYESKHGIFLENKAIPSILIGDVHYSDYDISFPSAEILAHNGITSVRFFPEMLIDDNNLPDQLQLGVKLGEKRYCGNPSFMKALDALEGYSAKGLCTDHVFIDGRQ